MSVLIFSGGVGLGAYQAGAYERMAERADTTPRWLAGSSIGAVNAAIIAGNASENRLARLAEMWWGSTSAGESGWPQFNHAKNWASAIKTRLTGSPGHFSPRVMLPWHRFKSVYDLSPLAERLPHLIDFGRLNSGEIRFTVATTDLETGDVVFFDTARGDRIRIEHLLASCGFIPEFAPLQIDGRLLGDGGLSANAPIEALDLEPEAPHSGECFVIDLFARDGVCPSDLESALSRKNDLIFSNQTWQRLLAFQRRCSLGQPSEVQDMVMLYLSYKPRAEEAGPERLYDYSRRSLDARWRAGYDDMTEALSQLDRWREAADKERCTLKAVRRREPALARRA